MKIIVQATISHVELLWAIRHAICDNRFHASEWCLHDAETLEAAARIIRSSYDPEGNHGKV